MPPMVLDSHSRCDMAALGWTKVAVELSDNSLPWRQAGELFSREGYEITWTWRIINRDLVYFWFKDSEDAILFKLTYPCTN